MNDNRCIYLAPGYIRKKYEDHIYVKHSAWATAMKMK